MKTFKDLIVWQRATEFAITVYKITSRFPATEQYGLINQLRRAVVSIPSNIAEGSKRGSKKDFTHFLRMAQGSCAEIETQITIANNLEFLPKESYGELLQELESIMKMLTRLINATKE
jgi:four helix bundle protein